MGYKEVVLADSPAGYWRFGEASGTSAADASGNGHTGTISATGIAYSQLGAISRVDSNTALGFTAASSGQVTIPTATALHPGDVFSLEVWLQSSHAGSVMCLFDSLTAGDYQWRLQADGTMMLLKRGVAVVMSSATAVNDGKWHHAVVTKNGATSGMYLDGQSVSPTITNATIVASTTDPAIGGGEFFWNGLLDEAAIYGSALSAAQVLNHYNVGITPEPPRSLLQQAVKRAAYY